MVRRFLAVAIASAFMGSVVVASLFSAKAQACETGGPLLTGSAHTLSGTALVAV